MKTRKLFNTASLDKSIFYVLNAIPNHFICSMNQKKFIKEMLIILNLSEYFPDENIFSLEVVSKFKPDPEIYLKCISAHALLMNESIAIEDSVSGVRSAVAAGLYTYGYQYGIPLSFRKTYQKLLMQAGASKVINSFSDIVV